MATIRHAVRRGLRDSTLGRYDRTYRRPHRRQACYGEFIMASFYQPRPRPGFLIDTSSSMEDSQLARAVSELASLDASARLRRGRGRRVLRCGRARREEGLHWYAGRVVRRRRHGHGCRAARVHREEERSDRPAGHRQRLPHAVAGGGSAISGHHHSRRRRHTAALGTSRRQQGDYDPGAEHHAERERRAKEVEVGVADASCPR